MVTVGYFRTELSISIIGELFVKVTIGGKGQKGLLESKLVYVNIKQQAFLYEAKDTTIQNL